MENKMMENKMIERDCENCDYNKPYYEHGELIGTLCSRWKCKDDEQPADLDCALRD